MGVVIQSAARQVSPSATHWRWILVAITLTGAVFFVFRGALAMFFAQVPAGDSLGKARDAMVATLEGVKTQPITAAEVERVRARALNEFDRIIASPQAFAGAISEAMASGDENYVIAIRSIQQVVQRHPEIPPGRSQ